MIEPSTQNQSSRRRFIRDLSLAGAVVGVGRTAAGATVAPSTPSSSGRAYWVDTLCRIVEPVVANSAAGKLREKMPVECPGRNVAERRRYTHLEALGRTLSGLAPWLELTGKPGPENELAGRLAREARQGLTNAVSPGGPDFIEFTAGGQCLVDAAFLSHAFLRSPTELWQKLDETTRARLIESVKSTRRFKPGQNNWLLFSAMVETFLAAAGAEWQSQPIETALTAFQRWYKGDGVYGDGPSFHWDYYNSYVIGPFLIDVLEQIGKISGQWSAQLGPVLARAKRYAAVQERLIAPDGTYPVLGRSIAYRCGAFQLLAQMALRQQLPDGVAPGQVRSALTAVIRKTIDAPDTFDANGWLTVGLAGHQPGLGENYISTGSLYLCTFAFLPLGLPASAPFWSDPPADWTARKIWAGKDLPADHAISD
jgi:hypothetical protein